MPTYISINFIFSKIQKRESRSVNLEIRILYVHAYMITKTFMHTLVPIESALSAEGIVYITQDFGF